MESDYLETMLSMSDGDLAKVSAPELVKLVRNLADLRYDGLTGLMTRTSFLKGLEKIKDQTAFVLFDVDYFKKINDSYGHCAGDLVLKEIGRILQENSRSNPGRRRDLIRYGGEELLAVLTKTTIHDAEAYANKMREIVSARTFFYEENTFQITLSAGVSHFDRTYDSEKTAERLLQEADIALYAAKKFGRNRTCLFQGTHSLVSK